ncbi:MAG: hypothetical protein HY317_03535 [Acidobacteria bacterium]|nr:hypothetical protein [Acidobacteriota bacterium]
MSEDGKRWRAIGAKPGRPGLRRQLGAPSQVLLVKPVRVRGVRVIQRGRSGRPWVVTELRLGAVVERR